MIKNYRCPKCQNLFSQQEYILHSKYCQGINIPLTTTQINTPIITTPINTPIITGNLNYTPNITNNSNIPNQNFTTYSTIPPNQSYIPLTNNINVTRSYRPQTAIYTNQIKNQNGININNTNVPQNYKSNYNNNYNNHYGINMKAPVESYFNCSVCRKRIPLINKKDHMLCHKFEQEDKDLMQAQKLQDDDIFNNLSPEEYEQQLKIEQYIKNQQQQRRNNNFPGNNNINNFITDDFNFGSDFGNINRMNEMNNFPNIIIRRITTNNNSPNFGQNMGNQEFFSNFFNEGFNNNNPSGIHRIMIPMSFNGNNMGGQQNELNDLIERMLHYSRENPTDQAIVSELPETKIDDIKKLDKDKQNCVICMEDFKNGDKITNLPCLHMFHTNCIQSWLKTQNTCPICKFKLTQDNINNINRRA